MSTTRDMVWVRSSPASHWAATAIPKNVIKITSIDLAKSTNIVEGAWPPGYTHSKGTIEHITIHAKVASTLSADVFFFSRAAGYTTLPATDSYVDHQSFAVGDFITHYVSTAASVKVASAGGLTIPYVDRDKGHCIHVGFMANKTITKGCLAIEIGWRPDAGGM
jgi:hypothetical protein